MLHLNVKDVIGHGEDLGRLDVQTGLLECLTRRAVHHVLSELEMSTRQLKGSYKRRVNLSSLSIILQQKLIADKEYHKIHFMIPHEERR